MAIFARCPEQLGVNILACRVLVALTYLESAPNHPEAQKVFGQDRQGVQGH